ncbi:MAG: hypothetical protein KA314_01010 [Chloroflexi bacterium]|nr:hypothetical protein [Chloroflexota bacterium]MBP8054387.1 hypothetical protein [Chloroflexota bacterium]
MAIIILMSRLALLFLAFIFFIFTPTVALVCGSVFYQTAAIPTCHLIPLTPESTLAQNSHSFSLDLPPGLFTFVGLALFAAACCAPILTPTLFTLLPQTPPPEGV